MIVGFVCLFLSGWENSESDKEKVSFRCEILWCLYCRFALYLCTFSSKIEAFEVPHGEGVSYSYFKCLNVGFVVWNFLMITRIQNSI